jgi:hypothetical protein
MPKKSVSTAFTLVALATAVFGEAQKVLQMPKLATMFCFAVSNF